MSVCQVHKLTCFIVVMYLGSEGTYFNPSGTQSDILYSSHVPGTEDTSATPSGTQTDIFVVVVYLGNEDTSGTPSATQADILYSSHVTWGSG